MDSKSFIYYIKKNVGIENISESDRYKLEFYIKAVEEIKQIYTELGENNECS